MRDERGIFDLMCSHMLQSDVGIDGGRLPVGEGWFVNIKMGGFFVKSFFFLQGNSTARKQG